MLYFCMNHVIHSNHCLPSRRISSKEFYFQSQVHTKKNVEEHEKLATTACYHCFDQFIFYFWFSLAAMVFIHSVDYLRFVYPQHLSISSLCIYAPWLLLFPLMIMFFSWFSFILWKWNIPQCFICDNHSKQHQLISFTDHFGFRWQRIYIILVSGMKEPRSRISNDDEAEKKMKLKSVYCHKMFSHRIASAI